MRHPLLVAVCVLACGCGSSSSGSGGTTPTPTPTPTTTVTAYAYTTLAGTAGTVVKTADGTGSAAQFDTPRGVAVDSAGNLYIGDTSNNTIRKVTPSGVTTTLAGGAGTAAFADATGTAARFNEPWGMAVDSAGTIYVADASNNSIRKVTAAGVVTTFAGSGGVGAGCTDATGTAARLDEPRGVAVDATGTVYVADYDNHVIRKITAAGVVTTLAGSCDVDGNADGTGAAARFRGPHGIAVDSAGTVYVADTGNRAIRKITPAGVVTTLALPSFSLSEPRGVAVDASGVIYIADYASHTIKKITTDNFVSVVAGAARQPGTTDATGTAARFHYPSGIAVAAGTLYVADTDNDTIRTISSSGVVTTLAGRAGQTSVVDATGAAARFEDPFSVAADVNGVVYVADSAAHVIRRISAAGEVTTYAGTAGSFGSADGTGSAARFYSPFGVAVDTAGNVYVADSYNGTVRKIGLGGVVTTLAGTALQGGSTDGTGAAARFDQPFGIAVDSNGNVYVSDATANTIRKITSAGVVTTLAGGSGQTGSTDATGTAARFSVPYAISVDTAGNVYVVDHGNHTIRKVTAAGVVTTLAGSAGNPGSTDGTGTSALFKYPSGVAVDASGTVFVADTDNHLIRQITAAGVVTTVGGATATGSTNGSGTAARFYNPKGIAVDRNGVLYIADRSNHTIRKGVLTTTTTTPDPVR
jgi:hypothetical protein